MSLYILDTDALSLVQHGNPAVLDALEAALTGTHSIGLTVITVEEQAKGWFAEFQTARTAARLARLSLRFADAVELWGTFRIFPQTEASLARFDQLVAAKLNVGKMDLRIASVALELGAVVVTHNQRDFGRVPGLLTADWTTPQIPPPTTPASP